MRKLTEALFSAALFFSIASSSKATDCANPAYVFAVDTVDDGSSGAAASFDFGAADGGRVLIDGLPDWIYEKNTDWRRVKVVQYDCAEDVRISVPPAPDVPGRFISVGMFPPATGFSYTGPADLAPANCTSPIYILGLNTVLDAGRYAIYAKALADSNLAPRHGSKRVFSGTPHKAFAGHWPAATTATITEWPCREAFETFYYSAEYQTKIFPLRGATARYRLVGFAPKAAP
jgi:uncharacterized protein (DUF1330 family)